jgi:threonine dehydratase
MSASPETPSPLPPAIAVFEAARRLRGVVDPTPLRRSEVLSARAGVDVWLKCEHEQRTGSFKARGAYNALASLPPNVRERGVVASSAGNHGLGIAFAARALGVRATVFVPATAPRVKKEGIARLGAAVDDSRPDYDAAARAAHELAAETGATYVDPCAGEAVLAGQGTVALEILAELPEVAAVVVPVGGGGLLGGIAALLRRVAPRVRIVGAQSVRTAAMARSLRAGRVVDIPNEPTLADGLAGGIAPEALAVGRVALDDIVTVEEDDIARAIALLHRTDGVTAEGSGAAAPAAVLSGAARLGAGPVVVVVSGGNIDRERLEDVLARFPLADAAARTP